jgi:hypothetical protein
MKASVTVPTSLSEVTLKQYQKFLKIQEMNEDEMFLQTKMIEIFCGVEYKDVLSIKVLDVERITKMLGDLFTQKPELVRSFKIDDVTYGFIPSLDDMTLGEYVDLDTFLGDWKNIHNAMNVLYRPVVQRSAERYKIADYDTTTKDRLLDMPMDAVISSIFFFFHLGIDLSIAMSHYSQEEVVKQQVLPQDLEKSGVGMDQYMHSLRKILRDLKISLN